MNALKSLSIQESTQEKPAHSRIKSASNADDLKSLKVMGVLNKSKFTVYLCEAPYANNKQFAMKVFPYKNNNPHTCYTKEARFSNFQHENIISVVATNSKKASTLKGQNFYVSYILMELAPYGDLADMIMTPKYVCDEKLVRTMFRQLVAGVEYIHSKNIAHLDIKPENILIGENYTLKLTDFDGSVSCEAGTQTHVGKKGGCGTINYRAPEMISNESFDPQAADIFSLAVVLFILRTGIFPYSETQEFNGQNFFNLLVSDFEKFWSLHPKTSEHSEIIGEDFKNLFAQMTQTNPANRATISDIKESAWYKGETYNDGEMGSMMSRLVSKIQKPN